MIESRGRWRDAAPLFRISPRLFVAIGSAGGGVKYAEAGHCYGGRLCFVSEASRYGGMFGDVEPS